MASTNPGGGRARQHAIHASWCACQCAWTSPFPLPLPRRPFSFEMGPGFTSGSASGDGMALRQIPGVVARGGGVPIRAGSETIGAIGVSGAPGGDKDEICAQAGIATVAAGLN